MKNDYNSKLNEQENYIALNYKAEEIFDELKKKNATEEQEYIYEGNNYVEKDENYIYQLENKFVEEIKQVYDFFWLDFVGFFTFFILFSITYLSKSKKFKAKPPLSLPSFQPTIPCQKCSYFDNNPYLKCALHPLEASTKEAINCSDFQHK